MHDDMKELCQPLNMMIEEMMRSMQSLRQSLCGWFSVSVDELATEISPMVAATMYAPLFSGEQGKYHLTTMIRHVLQERFCSDEVEVVNDMVYFTAGFYTGFKHNDFVAGSQREFLLQLKTGSAEISQELLSAAEGLIAKVTPRPGCRLDPRFVAYLIKNAMDMNAMTLDDITATITDEGR